MEATLEALYTAKFVAVLQLLEELVTHSHALASDGLPLVYQLKSSAKFSVDSLTTNLPRLGFSLSVRELVFHKSKLICIRKSVPESNCFGLNGSRRVSNLSESQPFGHLESG